MSRRNGFLVAVVLLLCVNALAQSNLQITQQPLPSASIDQPFSAMFQTTGGTPPLQWKLAKGTIPPGLILQSTGGILSGTPNAPGEYNFTITVTDAANKSAVANFTIRVAGYLTVRWKQPPTLKDNVLSGTVEVSNGSRDTYDQTVIIVAVNEFGKAFALGYERFNLAAQKPQVIPYSSLLPNGHYIVHVDAVAEIPARNVIRRARLQTPNAIAINVNR